MFVSCFSVSRVEWGKRKKYRSRTGGLGSSPTRLNGPQKITTLLILVKPPSRLDSLFLPNKRKRERPFWSRSARVRSVVFPQPVRPLCGAVTICMLRRSKLQVKAIGQARNLISCVLSAPIDRWCVCVGGARTKGNNGRQ